MCCINSAIDRSERVQKNADEHLPIQMKRLHNIGSLKLLCVVLVVWFSVTSVVENWLLIERQTNATRDHYISSTFLSISLFILFMSATQAKSNILCSLGERDSLYIYIFHTLFMMFFFTANCFLPDLWHDINLYVAPVIVLVLTIVFTKSLLFLHIIK